MSRGGRLLIVLAIGSLLMAGSRRSEYEIKAAFLYKFAAAVTWPEGTFRSADDPLVVAVIGEDPFKDDLERILGGKFVADRPLVLERYSELALLRPCHVLFIAESETDRMDALLDRLAGLPVLLVVDDDGLVEHRIMINFLTKGRKVRFSANAEAVQRAGLVMKSELLDLAVEP